MLRRAFTAVELMMVMGIMLIMMSITVPVILPSLRHGAVSSAVNDIQACWRLARNMAMSSSVPYGLLPYHYGIAITQPVSGQVTVSLIYDNENNLTPKLLMMGEDPSDPVNTYNPSNQPVAQYTFNRNVVLATSTATNLTPSSGPITIVIYAQYGTGLPIAPADVQAGRALVASTTSMGVSGMLATNLGAPVPTTPPPSVMAITELQTVDFSTSPRRGYSIAFAIFHAGFLAAEDK